MKRRILSPWLLITAALLVGMVVSGARLSAQQTAPQPDPQSSSPAAGQQSEPPAQQPDQQSPSQPSGQQTQPPAQQQAPDQSGRQTPPDTQAQAQPGQAQTFAGTVVKSGDKFVLQDASGTSYDVDRQDLLKKYEGKQVRVNGTLDADGKTIHVK